jgi:hypothetical protein
MLNQNVSLMKSMTSLHFASFTKRIRTMKISGLENIFYCDLSSKSKSSARLDILKSTGYEALHITNGTKRALGGSTSA